MSTNPVEKMMDHFSAQRNALQRSSSLYPMLLFGLSAMLLLPLYFGVDFHLGRELSLEKTAVLAVIGILVLLVSALVHVLPIHYHAKLVDRQLRNHNEGLNRMVENVVEAPSKDKPEDIKILFNRLLDVYIEMEPYLSTVPTQKRREEETEEAQRGDGKGGNE